MALFLKTPFIPTTSTATRSPRKLVPSQQQRQWGRWECRKKGGVHPEFYEDARVYCNGELVMTTGGTQREYTVDVWSGNHPFYLGSRSALLADADQVDKFRKRYGQLSSLMEIPVLRHGEIVLPQRKKSSKGKGGAKK
ncbi:50S ribosomal protein L31, chloroplastic-like isoform X1 [Ananas comosus]|uniref:50S ribosomal protein L31 n=1 Tax=Ananas comosus TaxID=4615 RepID=A0A6P5G037_ANACO|nr:50S ribosomal protein L31, chloroplastic-like isoform X1 [Ananas comosus]